MNHLKITDANYLPVTERKVLRLPSTGVLLLFAYVLARVTLLPPALQQNQASDVTASPETTL